MDKALYNADFTSRIEGKELEKAGLSWLLVGDLRGYKGFRHPRRKYWKE